MAIRHENVVTTHEVVDALEPPILVMEYVRGGSLQHQIDQHGPPPIPEVARIGREVARGLAAIHERRLVHTDLKPANILMDETSGRTKLSDFGLSRVVAPHGRAKRQLVVTGTPSYMSPEQAQGFPLDPRSDLHSLGAVLYAACTGDPPFPGDSTVAVLRDVCGREPAPVQSLRPEVPDWLADLVRELLAKTPSQRPARAEDDIERLRPPSGAPRADAPAPSP
jgi:serine/threonine protein kinase